MKMLHMVAFLLTAIGAINWGLTALGLNLVNMILRFPFLHIPILFIEGTSQVLGS